MIAYKPIKFMKLTTTAKEPERGSPLAAGYDLHADILDRIAIMPGECKKIPTGIAVELPESTFGGVYARSGLATKRGLRLANNVGIIDSDYRGEIIVALYNDSDQAQVVFAGERIAQLIIQPYIPVTWVEADELSTTARGEGGFGSTGV